jgi:hypothetical protein
MPHIKYYSLSHIHAFTIYMCHGRTHSRDSSNVHHPTLCLCSYLRRQLGFLMWVWKMGSQARESLPLISMHRLASTPLARLPALSCIHVSLNPGSIQVGARGGVTGCWRVVLSTRRLFKLARRTLAGFFMKCRGVFIRFRPVLASLSGFPSLGTSLLTSVICLTSQDATLNGRVDVSCQRWRWEVGGTTELSLNDVSYEGASCGTTVD